MNTSDFVDFIPDFDRLNVTDKIKCFCWHLTIHRSADKFSGAMVANCFRTVNLPEPSSAAAFMKSLAEQEPPFLLKRNGLYELSRHGRRQLDELYGQRSPTIAVHELLDELPAKLTIEIERAFFNEALLCFRNKAFRAAIVMTWNLAYDHLCRLILAKHLSAFNDQLPKSYPKAPISEVLIQDHFERLKESEVIQVAKSADIIPNSVFKILNEKLDRRNIAAHPSQVIVSQLTAEDFILDLINNVVLKYS